MTDKLSRRERNPYLSIIEIVQKLSSNDSSKSLGDLAEAQQLLSRCKSIFSSDQVSKAFLYLSLNRAATSWILQVQLSMPEATSYRVLKTLRSMGAVEPVLKLPRVRVSRKGRLPRVWGLVGLYSTEDIARCINLHYRTLSPKYRMAEEIAQTILEDYSKRNLNELSFRELLVYVKEKRLPFRAVDVADLTAEYLTDRGMKVWR